MENPPVVLWRPRKGGSILFASLNFAASSLQVASGTNAPALLGRQDKITIMRTWLGMTVDTANILGYLRVLCQNLVVDGPIHGIFWQVK